MPSNVVQINYFDDLTWDVGDSKMDDLITYLDKVGHRRSNKDKDKEKEITSSSDALS